MLDEKIKGVSTYTIGRTIYGDDRDDKEARRGFGFIMVGNDGYVPGAHDAEKKALSEISLFCCNLCRKYEQENFTFVVPYGVKGKLLVGLATPYGVDFIHCKTNGKEPSAEFDMDAGTMIEASQHRIMASCEYCISHHIEVKRLSVGVDENMSEIKAVRDDKKSIYLTEKQKQMKEREIKSALVQCYKQKDARAAIISYVTNLSKEDKSIAAKLLYERRVSEFSSSISRQVMRHQRAITHQQRDEAVAR